MKKSLKQMSEVAANVLEGIEVQNATEKKIKKLEQKKFADSIW